MLLTVVNNNYYCGGLVMLLFLPVEDVLSKGRIEKVIVKKKKGYQQIKMARDLKI